MKERWDRVREHSPDEANREIDRNTAASLRFYAGESDRTIAERLGALDREWDAERVLMTNASAFALTGLVLGMSVNRRWLTLPAVVLPFLLQHAVQGWCPPLPVIRRIFGARTRKEIDRERYALKALRGDFAEANLAARDPDGRVERALAAASS